MAFSSLTLPSRQAFVSRDVVRLGMPHLSLGGLSETWLLKELGDRHWMLLAKLAGREIPDFRDESGARVYAAFAAVSIREASLASFVEHDELVIESEITRISGAQFASLHRLSRRGRPAGVIELVSVFVKRRVAGRNRSIMRTALDCFPPPEAAGPSFTAAATAARIRAGAFEQHFGFSRSDSREIGRLLINPCPSQDFNGADFLYFTSFQSFVDRTEWELLAPERGLSTQARDIVYRGNIEPGDKIVVMLSAIRQGEGTLAHWSQITRDSDGAHLADIFTLKRAGRR
ncbi:Pnap_2097 family protein [Methylocella silvestris]|nr:Pnap_2097 family protein [Methylocella silvestris]